jgi:hypothetical protein
MALHRRVIEADDAFSELYADTFSNVSDEECEREALDSDFTTSSAGKNNHYLILKFL